MGMKPHCGLVTVSQTLGKISKTYHWPGIHHAKVELFTCAPLGIEAWKRVNVSVWEEGRSWVPLGS